MAKMKKMKTVIKSLKKIGLIVGDNASRQGATGLNPLDAHILFFLGYSEESEDATNFTLKGGEFVEDEDGNREWQGGKLVGIKTDLAKRTEQFMSQRPAGALWNPVHGAPIVEKATDEDKRLAGDQREFLWNVYKALPTDFKLVIRRQIAVNDGENPEQRDSKVETLKVELNKSDLLNGYAKATGCSDDNPRGDEIEFAGRVASSRQMLLRLAGLAYLDKIGETYEDEIEFVVKSYESNVERFLDNVRENNGKTEAQRKLTALDQFEIGLSAYEDHGFSIGELRSKKICGLPGMAQKVQGAIRLLNAFPKNREAILKAIRHPDNRFKSTNKEVMREMLENEELTAQDVVAYFTNPKAGAPERTHMMSKKDIKSEHEDTPNPVVKEILGAMINNNSSALTSYRKDADLWASFKALLDDGQQDALRAAFKLIEDGAVIGDVSDVQAVEEALS